MIGHAETRSVSVQNQGLGDDIPVRKSVRHDADVGMDELLGIHFQYGQVIGNRIKRKNASAGPHGTRKYRGSIAGACSSIDDRVIRYGRYGDTFLRVEVLSAKQGIFQARTIDDVTVALIFKVEMFQLSKCAARG